MAVKLDKSVRVMDFFVIGVPLLSLVAVFVTLLSDVKSNKDAIGELVTFNKNIGSILTSHTTQLAIKDVQVATLTETQKKLEEKLDDIE